MATRCRTRPCRRGSTSGSDALLPEERALFGLGERRARRAEALTGLCDENGFAEEEEEEN